MASDVKQVQITSSDVAQIQLVLDHAFARFRSENPEVARTIELMNVSFAEYLQILAGLNQDIPTTVGGAYTSR